MRPVTDAHRKSVVLVYATGSGRRPTPSHADQVREPFPREEEVARAEPVSSAPRSPPTRIVRCSTEIESSASDAGQPQDREARQAGSAGHSSPLRTDDSASESPRARHAHADGRSGITPGLGSTPRSARSLAAGVSVGSWGTRRPVTAAARTASRMRLRSWRTVRSPASPASSLENASSIAATIRSCSASGASGTRTSRSFSCGRCLMRRAREEPVERARARRAARRSSAR